MVPRWAQEFEEGSFISEIIGGCEPPTSSLVYLVNCPKTDSVPFQCAGSWKRLKITGLALIGLKYIILIFCLGWGQIARCLSFTALNLAPKPNGLSGPDKTDRNIGCRVTVVERPRALSRLSIRELPAVDTAWRMSDQSSSVINWKWRSQLSLKEIQGGKMQGDYFIINLAGKLLGKEKCPYIFPPSNYCNCLEM